MGLTDVESDTLLLERFLDLVVVRSDVVAVTVSGPFPHDCRTSIDPGCRRIEREPLVTGTNCDSHLVFARVIFDIPLVETSVVFGEILIDPLLRIVIHIIVYFVIVVIYLFIVVYVIFVISNANLLII